MKENKKYHYINKSAVLTLILCLSVLVVFLYYLLTNQYRIFVTPRLKVVLILCCAGLFCMVVVSAKNLFTPCYKVNYKEYMLLVVFFFLMLSQMNADGNQQASNMKKGKNQVVSQKKGNVKETPSAVPTPEPTPELKQEEEQAATEVVHNIKVQDEAFYQWISKLCVDDKTYKGASITIKGMVYKDKDLTKKNYFALVRLAMVCCSADLVPVGPICDGVDVTKLKEDEYITVEGKVGYVTYEGEVQPIIHVKRVTKASKPKEEYVYP